MTISPGQITTFTNGTTADATQVNNNFTVCVNEINAIDVKLTDYNVTSSGTPNSNGVYPTVQYKRSDGTLYLQSSLTNPDANGNWQTDTWTYYDTNGTTVLSTLVWTLAYDANGNVTSRTHN